jgi:hypothetical protein
VEAALLSLPDAVEEIYQAVITTSSAAADGSARLTDAIERLRLEEELETSYGEEIREIVPSAAPRPVAAAATAKKA